jgi:hypothetical protein
VSIYLNDEKREALYASIHRLAKEHEPTCTLEQVKKVCNMLHGHDYTRQEAAFCLYWELSEKKEGMIARRFLNLLTDRCKDEKAAEERIRQAKKASRERVKNFWVAS